MKNFLNTFMFYLLSVVSFEAGAQNQPNVDSWWVDTTNIIYDFEQDGIYYKFAPAPRCDIYEASYYSTGFKTGLENEEGDILWVTGCRICETQCVDIDTNGKPYVRSINTYNCSYSGDVYIPDYVEYEGNTYPVKGLSSDAFKYSISSEDWVYDGVLLQKKITSVRLPETLEYIGYYAFGHCQKGFPLKKFPNSLKYIDELGITWLSPLPEIPDNVLYMKDQIIIDDEIERFKYPQNAIYAGQVKMNAKEVIYPPRMQYLVGTYPHFSINIEDMEPVEGKSGIVIPDNGVFYVCGFGMPKDVKTIYSYAPLMKNVHKGRGLAFDEDAVMAYFHHFYYEYIPAINEKTLYVLSGLKEAYSEEWPELLAGGKYTDGYIVRDKPYMFEETLIHYSFKTLQEDHIIEVSREEMDAMVEAAGLTVPPINTAIDEVQTEPSRKVEEAIYGIDGRRLPKLQKGVNIVRQSDGTTRKVYVRE